MNSRQGGRPQGPSGPSRPGNRNQHPQNRFNHGSPNKFAGQGRDDQNSARSADVKPVVKQEPHPSPKVQQDAKENSENCRLFVGNLPPNMTDDDFKKMFADHGEVKEVFVSKQKGFGFVSFNTSEQAASAKKALDNTEKEGKKLRVRFANSNRDKPNPQQPPVQPQPDTSYYEEVPKPKKSSGKCRLFVGNLPNSITDEEFQNMFEQFGQVTEIFLQKQKGFGFVKLDSRQSAEAAKNALDNTLKENKYLQVKFANQGSSIKVKNLTPWVSNELLEHAFSNFGEIDRAVVIVDDRGRPTGEGIVEFARRQAAQICLRKCSQGCLLLTSSPIPVELEPLEVRDDEEGFPEKNINKNNPQYLKERDIGPRFAEPGSFEYEFANRWKQLLELENQKKEFLEREILEERSKLQEEGDFLRYEHEANCLREQLRMIEEQNKLMAREREMRLDEQKRRDDFRMQQQLMLRQREDEILGVRQDGRGNQNEGPRMHGGSMEGAVGPGGKPVSNQDGYRSAPFDGNRPQHDFNNGPGAAENANLNQAGSGNAVNTGAAAGGGKNNNSGMGDGRQSRFDQYGPGHYSGVPEGHGRHVGRDQMEAYERDAKRRRY